MIKQCRMVTSIFQLQKDAAKLLLQLLKLLIGVHTERRVMTALKFNDGL